MRRLNETFYLYRLLNFTHRLLFRLAVAPFFNSFGRNSAFLRGGCIEGIGRIRIGNRVHISYDCLLAAVPHTGQEQCQLVIGDGCSFGRNNRIYATFSVIFEQEVLTADNVYVSDNAHSYCDTAVAVMEQPIRQLSPVTIGQGSWLGQNVCVIGASIGKGCVIGANSVVISDVPDYCVAVGAPARVIRRVADAAADPTTASAATGLSEKAQY